MDTYHQLLSLLQLYYVLNTRNHKFKYSVLRYTHYDNYRTCNKDSFCSPNPPSGTSGTDVGKVELITDKIRVERISDDGIH